MNESSRTFGWKNPKLLLFQKSNWLMFDRTSVIHFKTLTPVVVAKWPDCQIFERGLRGDSAFDLHDEQDHIRYNGTAGC